MTNRRRKKKRNLPAKSKPVAEQPENTAAARLISQQTHFQGPIPDPQTLQKYGVVDRDLPTRIVDMATREAAHRQGFEVELVSIERVKIESDYALARRGQWFGFFAAALGVFGSVALGYLGHAIPASVVGGVTIVGVVTVFVTGRFLEKNG